MAQLEIRFNGFSDEWVEKTLDEISDKVIKGSAKADSLEIGQNAIYLDTKYLNTKSNPITTSANANVSENDVLILWDGSKAGVVYKGTKGVLGSTLKSLKINSKTSSDYVYQVLKNSESIIFDRYRTPNIPHVVKDFTRKFPIQLPTLPEQQKIGALFSKYDAIIALREQKLKELNALKKGMLQQMFPKNGEKVPELRFEGFTYDWEERNLGDVTTWTKGQGLTKEDLNEERDGSEAVHYADLYKFSPVMHNVIHWTNSDDGRIIPDNSLLFPASDVTPVGLARASTLRLSGVKAGGDVIIGQLDESINSSFMSYQINANSKKILPLITGTTVKHVQAKSLATVSVSITNMAEQTAIAGIFERIDNLIALHQRKLDLLKEQKKGFLQKMFV